MTFLPSAMRSTKASAPSIADTVMSHGHGSVAGHDAATVQRPIVESSRWAELACDLSLPLTESLGARRMRARSVNEAVHALRLVNLAGPSLGGNWMVCEAEEAGLHKQTHRAYGWCCFFLCCRSWLGVLPIDPRQHPLGCYRLRTCS